MVVLHDNTDLINRFTGNNALSLKPEVVITRACASVLTNNSVIKCIRKLSDPKDYNSSLKDIFVIR